MNTADSLKPMLLNMQMIADPLDEQYWDFTLHSENDVPRFRSCLLYSENISLQNDVVYVIPEELEEHFPTDDYGYIASHELPGQAPHICGLNRPLPEILNRVISIFQQYYTFEFRLNQILNTGGSLKDLCRLGSEFFHNPMYVHDNMFAVLAFSSRVEGMLKFEYNEKTGKLHIPLWLIDEFKFDTDYQDTLLLHSAGLWDNTQYPQTMRSLYVNLWSGNTYYGRVLINEIGTRLLPGQSYAAEFFAQYVLLLLRQGEQSLNHDYHSFEDTFVDLMQNRPVDQRDLWAMMNILDWKENDRYLCIKLRNQTTNLAIRSDSALDSTLASMLNGYSSFYHQQQLCIVINLTRSGQDPDSLRLLLAPHVRDSYMYGGISNPVDGIFSLYAGFFQTDVVLDYIVTKDRSKWLLPFSACAFSYILENALRELPAELLSDPILNDLRRFDSENDTQYYETLRAYLMNERNIPKTSEALIIHRTTLTYRLKKIDELLKVNLDDENRRLYTLLSFYLSESHE